MTTTEIKDMIRKYRIEDARNGKLHILAKVSPSDVEQIKAAKSEILSYFENERNIAAQAVAHEKEVFEAIPGLTQLRDARRRWAVWQYEFNRRMENEALSSVIPAAPTDDLRAIESQYPDAVFALGIENKRSSSNYEIAAIANKTYHNIVTGVPIAEAKAGYEQSMAEFTDRKIWD